MPSVGRVSDARMTERLQLLVPVLAFLLVLPGTNEAQVSYGGVSIGGHYALETGRPFSRVTDSA